MNKSVRRFGFRGLQQPGGAAYAAMQIGEGLIDRALREADAQTEFIQKVARDLIEMRLAAID
jgi:hypothetical protein